MNEDLKALLSKTLNIDDSKYSELVKTDEDGNVKSIDVNGLLELDKARISKINTDHEAKAKERHKNGLSQGKSEALGIFETSLREKFGVESDKKGVDLVADIIASKAEKSGKEVEMTPEKIKVSKPYLDMVEKMEQEKQTAVDEALKPLNEQINGFKRQSTLNAVNRVANGIIDTLNPRFSEDKAKASNQRNVILDNLAKLNYQVDGERITLLNDKGEQLNDDHGNPVKFEDKVKGITTNLYDLKESKPRKSGGAYEDDDEGSKKPFKWNGVTPKDQREYDELVQKADSLEEKKAIMEAWQKQQYDD